MCVWVGERQMDSHSEHTCFERYLKVIDCGHSNLFDAHKVLKL